RVLFSCKMQPRLRYPRAVAIRNHRRRGIAAHKREVVMSKKLEGNVAVVTGTSKGTALITGASTGIGAVYADRLARPGYDLVLAARNEARLKALSARLTEETGRSVTPLRADLNDKADIGTVERLLRTDE